MNVIKPKKFLKILDHDEYLNYKAKVIFSYNGFIGKYEWLDYRVFKMQGLQDQTAGFAGQFLYLNWNAEENRNLVDIETYKTLYDIDTQLGVGPTGQLHNCLQLGIH